MFSPSILWSDKKTALSQVALSTENVIPDIFKLPFPHTVGQPDCQDLRSYLKADEKV